LSEKEIISSEDAEKLVKMAGFRNILIHEYRDILIEKVYDILKGKSKVLVVHNIQDGMGDELIRTGTLLSALLRTLR